jgi:hypothetical protein
MGHEPRVRALTATDEGKSAFEATDYPGEDEVVGHYLDEAESEFRLLMGRRWQDLEIKDVPGLSLVSITLINQTLMVAGHFARCRRFLKLPGTKGRRFPQKARVPLGYSRESSFTATRLQSD